MGFVPVSGAGSGSGAGSASGLGFVPVSGAGSDSDGPGLPASIQARILPAIRRASSSLSGGGTSNTSEYAAMSPSDIPANGSPDSPASGDSGSGSGVGSASGLGFVPVSGAGSGSGAGSASGLGFVPVSGAGSDSDGPGLPASIQARILPAIRRASSSLSGGGTSNASEYAETSFASSPSSGSFRASGSFCRASLILAFISPLTSCRSPKSVSRNDSFRNGSRSGYSCPTPKKITGLDVTFAMDRAAPPLASASLLVSMDPSNFVYS